MRHLAEILGAWSLEPPVVVGLLACGGVYLAGVRRLARGGPGPVWQRRSTASFLLGLALVWIALLGPVGTEDDTFFWAHMVQHLVLTMLAAPFLLLGAPVLLLLRVSGRPLRRAVVLPVLRSRVVRALTHPVVGWLIFAGVLVGTHFSPFFDYALRHPLVHEWVEHPLYLGAALVYYYPLLPGNPSPGALPPAGRALSLFLMMVPETMTGFFLYASPYPLYSYYAGLHNSFGPDPLTDQQLAGSLMWAGSMVIDSVWVSVAVLAWLRSEERKSRRPARPAPAAPPPPAGPGE